MLGNVRIANDSGYVTFRSEKAFVDASLERYRRKKSLWINSYEYADSDRKNIEILYLEIEKIMRNESVKIIRVRAAGKAAFNFWESLGFQVRFKTTNADGSEEGIMIKYLVPDKVRWWERLWPFQRNN